MKKTTLSLFIAALAGGIIFASSCNKGKVNPSDAKHEIITGNLSFEIPIIPTNGEYDSITAFTYKTNMDSIIKGFSSQYDFNSIRSVNLRSCVLTLENFDAANNFRNFHTVNIGITSGSYGRIYRIASAMDVVDTAAYYLDVPALYEPNLERYFKTDSLCYRIYGNMRRPTTTTLKGKATLVYDMELRD